MRWNRGYVAPPEKFEQFLKQQGLGLASFRAAIRSAAALPMRMQSGMPIPR